MFIRCPSRCRLPGRRLALPAILGDPMADAPETSKLFCVHMDHVAGALSLVQPHRRYGLKVQYPAQPHGVHLITHPTDVKHSRLIGVSRASKWRCMRGDVLAQSMTPRPRQPHTQWPAEQGGGNTQLMGSAISSRPSCTGCWNMSDWLPYDHLGTPEKTRR